MALWRRVVIDQVASLAGKAIQQRAWFRCGPWNAGPRDEINLFFDHAAVLELMARTDNGLNEQQAAMLTRLAVMLDRLRESPPEMLQAEAMFDDPRWRAIRRQARITLRLLAEAV